LRKALHLTLTPPPSSLSPCLPLCPYSHSSLSLSLSLRFTIEFLSQISIKTFFLFILFYLETFKLLCLRYSLSLSLSVCIYIYIYIYIYILCVYIYIIVHTLFFSHFFPLFLSVSSFFTLSYIFTLSINFSFSYILLLLCYSVSLPLSLSLSPTFSFHLSHFTLPILFIF
jgi:hypothetical protein